MEDSVYPVLSICPQQIVGDEQRGTKPKFWFEHDGSLWLFKETRKIDAQHADFSGEDWSEKIAAELASSLQIPAAQIELAECGGRRGCASKRFTSPIQQLRHGDEILEGHIENYDRCNDRENWYKHSDHTLENIILAIQRMFPQKDDSRVVLTQLASYLVLDALVCNVDRHHENWGLLWQVVVDHDDFRETSRVFREYSVAPSYDHASSLGREFRDEKRLDKLHRGTVENYVRKGSGGIYLAGEGKGANPLRLVELTALKHAHYFETTLEKLRKTPFQVIASCVDHVPDSRMSSIAKEFAKAMLQVTFQALTRIRL